MDHPLTLVFKSFHSASSYTLPPEIMQHTFLPWNLYLFFITAATTVAEDG